ncbi:MAG: branched-chain amino acid ABC transporter permease [Acetobacteraceae bacterium]
MPLSPLLASLAQHVVDGVVLGAILALPALGLALVWRIAGFPHFAHGSLMTIGAYVAWSARVVGDLPFALAVLLGVGAATAAGLGMHLTVYSRLRGRPMLSLFLSSIGVELFLRYAIILVFGTDFHSFPIPAERGIRLGLVVITPVDLVILASGVAALAAVWWMFRGTRIGRRIRAVADNPALARLSGISPQRTLLSVWALVSVLAAISGILLGVRNVLSPTLGWDVLLLAFAAAILGGITNPFGAAIGAFLMGIVGQIGIVWVPTSYQQGIAFVLIVLVLLVRPRGLFGEAVRV